ncbi:MAG: pyridoxal phosphate-dependent aminotransferase [Syntrophobacteraceae bacterium]
MIDLLSNRAKTIQPSITLTISAKAKAMKADGLPVLNFSAGEPDFHTPDLIKEAGIQAIREGFTRYTAAGGTPELKAAISEKYEEELGLTFGPSEILVSNGGKHALHSVFQALLNPGDEVVIPAPYWLSYPDMVSLSDGKPVTLKTRMEDGYKLTIDNLKSVLTPGTKALILNSPSNPTGTLYSAEDLAAIASVVEPLGIVVISDDVYEKSIYDGGTFVNILSVAPQLRDRVVIINSASKTYSMPGWRMGYAIGPAALIAGATRIQGQATSSAGSISQKALTFALRNTDPQIIENFRQSFEKRRNLMFEGLQAIDWIDVHRPAGAFYLFANVSRLMNAMEGINGSVDFCDFLLERCNIACVPGKPFGDDECIRFSFVAEERDIMEGIERLRTLSPPVARASQS